jgi:hypothetical protein
MFETRPDSRFRFLRPLVLSLLTLVLVTPLLQAQAVIKVNDNVNLRFGLLLQSWADAQEDATTGGYGKNLFIRRIRFLVGGQISPNVSFFFETDNPNDGKATKALGSGFITQDAFLSWKPAGSNAFIIDGGLFLPPLCRNCVESAATLLSLDYGSYSFTESAATQSVVGRDTGFQARGYVGGGHVEYRAAVLQGFRAAGSRNSFRTTGRLQFNPWDTEAGYTYPGVYLGNKRVLALGVGFDRQQDYKGISADAFLSIPTGAAGPTRNAFNGELTILSFDGDTTFAAIPEQRDATLQLGYYLAGPKVMPFVRAEKQDFRARANNGRDNNRQQVGVTFYPNGHNFNVKGAYSRVKPRNGDSTNEFTIQLQFFYY